MNDSDSYVRFCGTITGLRQRRLAASFVLTESDRAWGALGAIAAAATGNGGVAIMTASSMGDTNEEADFLEFSLDDKAFGGWLWRNPFKEGDTVEVVASPVGDSYTFIAISRPADGIIALFPHCSRGKRSHVMNALKWWLVISAFFALPAALMAMFYGGLTFFLDSLREYSIVMSATVAYCALSIAFLTRKWMPFVRKAEVAFRALGWSSPSSIDLKRLSKENRRRDDKLEYGVFYFRYDSSVFAASNSTA